MSLQDHPIAACFPLMSEDELLSLASDVEQRGLLHDILLFEGKILDGRNRYRACQMCGVEPGTYELPEDHPLRHDPLALVVSLKLRRQHLTDSQRAMAAAKLANLSWGGDRRSDQAANVQVDPVTQAEAAEKLDVSPRSVASAKKVLNAAPALAEEVSAGKLTVNAAIRRISPPKSTKQAPLKTADEIVDEAIHLLEQLPCTGIDKSLAFHRLITWINAQPLTVQDAA